MDETPSLEGLRQAFLLPSHRIVNDFDDADWILPTTTSTKPTASNKLVRPKMTINTKIFLCLFYAFKILFFLKGYSLITSTGTCRHINGGVLSTCQFPRRVRQKRNCEKFCTYEAYCVGYIYKAGPSFTCWLIPSKNRHSLR